MLFPIFRADLLAPSPFPINGLTMKSFVKKGTIEGSFENVDKWSPHVFIFLKFTVSRSSNIQIPVCVIDYPLVIRGLCFTQEDRKLDRNF